MVQNFGQFRDRISNISVEDDSAVYAKIFTDFVNEMRRDLGHSEAPLTILEVMSVFIKSEDLREFDDKKS